MSLSHHDSLPNRFRHRMRAAVEETIVAYDMLQTGDSVLVGVSGGADSVALLHLLVAASRTLPIRLGVVHLDHSLRHAESDRDAEFVA
ncbi:MAG: ATP-binding protein, partial [Desulfobacterales bacterium]